MNNPSDGLKRPLQADPGMSVEVAVMRAILASATQALQQATRSINRTRPCNERANMLAALDCAQNALERVLPITD